MRELLVPLAGLSLREPATRSVSSLFCESSEESSVAVAPFIVIVVSQDNGDGSRGRAPYMRLAAAVAAATAELAVPCEYDRAYMSSLSLPDVSRLSGLASSAHRFACLSNESWLNSDNILGLLLY